MARAHIIILVVPYLSISEPAGILRATKIAVVNIPITPH